LILNGLLLEQIRGKTIQEASHKAGSRIEKQRLKGEYINKRRGDDMGFLLLRHNSNSPSEAQSLPEGRLPQLEVHL
jgi:hypothetical protein